MNNRAGLVFLMRSNRLVASLSAYDLCSETSARPRQQPTSSPCYALALIHRRTVDAGSRSCDSSPLSQGSSPDPSWSGTPGIGMNERAGSTWVGNSLWTRRTKAARPPSAGIGAEPPNQRRLQPKPSAARQRSHNKPAAQKQVPRVSSCHSLGLLVAPSSLVREMD